MSKRRIGLEHIDLAVGATIKRARLTRGLSQERVAELMGVTFQQIQKYEKGSNGVSTSRLPSLCKALGITPNDLFGWTGGGGLAELSAMALKTAVEFDALPPNRQRIVRGVVIELGRDEE
jgi:transcriptional regulator with XRE-family HTH domain